MTHAVIAAAFVLQSPRALWLLLLPIALVALTAARLRQSRGERGNAVATSLRGIALCVLVVALAQPTWQVTQTSMGLTLVLDNSASISPTGRATEAHWLLDGAAAASSASPLRVVTFAGSGSALTVEGPLSRSTVDGLLRPAGDASQTDLAGALELAAGIAPSHSRVVVLTDGLQTTGDAGSALSSLVAGHLTVDTVALSEPLQPDEAVTRVALPPSAPEGAAQVVQVTINSTEAQTSTLRVRIDGRTIGSQSLALPAGTSSYLVNLPGQAAGWHTVQVTARASADVVPQNNSLSAVVDVVPPPSVLLVDRQAPSSEARTVLGAAPVSIVETLPRAVPTSPARLAQYSSVVLDNLPASAFSAAQVAALDTAVQKQGVGLFVLGGSHSLTLGHYSETALERLLPLQSETPASLQNGNVALQLVLDRSGSMDDLAGGDVPKIQMSRSAARLAAGFAMQHTDDFGILAFDQVSHILVPMGKVTSADAARLNRAINGMFSDGGTNIYQALQQGIQQVSRSAAPYRHIILMTDGRSDPANYQPLFREAAADRVTISTVGLGLDADTQLLRYMAAQGKGRFYFTNNGADLPRIFAEEARLSAGSAAVTGTIAVQMAHSSPLTRDLPSGRLPNLAGYVATVLKPDASADLVTSIRNRRPDPLLAHWQYGLGRVAVWTPGLEGSWPAPWRPAQDEFWSDVLQWSLRGPSTPAYAASIVPSPAGYSIQIDTLTNTGAAQDLQQIDVDVRAPDGRTSNLLAIQTEPGLYRVPLALTAPGAYVVTARPVFGGAAAQTTTVLAVPYATEYRPAAANVALLETIAGSTGGAVLSAAGAPPSARPPAGQTENLAWPLALAALLLFFAAVGAERLATDMEPAGP